MRGAVPVAPGAALVVLLAAAVAWPGPGLGDGAPAAAPAPDLEVFTREGCPRCEEALRWLDGLRAARPGLVVAVADVARDPAALARLRDVAGRAHTGAVSVPAFLVRGTLVVGFAGRDTTGARVEALLAGAEAPPGPGGEAAACRAEEPVCAGTTAAPAPPGDEVTLPLFGRVRVRDLGLPLFTLAIGLVDGFNPCATWVLLFLLSFLATLRSRARMLLIAGEFVLVSAIAYYAFMAAWIAVFAVVGLSRAVQVALASFGLVVGLVNVKDFFALHRGPSFSIPEAAKPGIYRRMRAVVRARTLLLALAAAGVLAVLVNFVELLCTAGLPALYTQVLAAQPIPAWKRYAYLGLYDLAYMADDALMVGVAVVTLGHRKLQEQEGRWLKLVSGGVMIAIAALLLLRPEWLSP
jgi:glutaredoxin